MNLPRAAQALEATKFETRNQLPLRERIVAFIRPGKPSEGGVLYLSHSCFSSSDVTGVSRSTGSGFKVAILWLCILGSACNAFGQGLVNFFNTPSTLISGMGGGAGTFYFALLTAPAGTTDPHFFTFSGCYATNMSVAGRINGGGGVAVRDWPAGTARSFMVCGWSAEMGHAWNPAWLDQPWLVGMSMIATGIAGGWDPVIGGPIPNLNLFGSLTISSGFMAHGCLGPYWYGIFREPTNQIINAGSTARFCVAATACPLPWYQWYFNGTPIPGAQGASFQIDNVQPEQAGNYYAILSNPEWPIISGTSHSSATATLIVLTKPWIVVAPEGQFAALGSTVHLSVEAAGPPPLSYQWLFGGTPLAGATGTELWLTNFQASQAGTYSVVVTNAYGATLSSAKVGVMPEPGPAVVDIQASGGSCAATFSNISFAFSQFEDAVGPARFPVFDTVFLTPADVGRQITVTADEDPDFTGLAAILTNGVSDWVGYRVSMGPCGFGTTSPEGSFFNPLPAGCNGIDFQGLILKSLTLQVDGLTIIALNNSTTVSLRLKLYVNFEVPQPPFIQRQPQSQTAEAGGTARLSVGAKGWRPLSYQWFLEGTNPATPPGTNWNLLLTNLVEAQSGMYVVVITNGTGAVTSAPAWLNVIAPVPRRAVPAILVDGEPGSSVYLQFSSGVGVTPAWVILDAMELTNPPQWYFDLNARLPGQRFYRLLQESVQPQPPALDLHLVPAITLTGAIGQSLRVDSIHQYGPVDDWLPLGTVTLTNGMQLFFDTTAPGQPSRLYRVVPIP